MHKRKRETGRETGTEIETGNEIEWEEEIKDIFYMKVATFYFQANKNKFV